MTSSLVDGLCPTTTSLAGLPKQQTIAHSYGDPTIAPPE